MKIDCGLSPEERWELRETKRLEQYARRLEWHVWFAWYPVRVGKGDCRWLERVERRQLPQHFLFESAVWEYRALA